jgi:CDP-6-deoxy-D-xylo-4-hexulose-3-dehydrase
LDKKIFFLEYDLIGNSNYAFPLILRSNNIKKRNKLEKLMNKFNIEFRRGNAGGGNQMRQPYIKNYVRGINIKKFKNVEHVHNFGYYIGNFPSLKKDKILKLAAILNSL